MFLTFVSFFHWRSGYGKQVPVIFEIAQNVNDRIITDEEWLWQMILNLLTNACKYTDRGEIRVVLSVTNAAITPHTPRNSIQAGSNSSYTPTVLTQEMLLVEVIDTGSLPFHLFHVCVAPILCLPWFLFCAKCVYLTSFQVLE